VQQELGADGQGQRVLDRSPSDPLGVRQRRGEDVDRSPELRRTAAPGRARRRARGRQPSAMARAACAGDSVPPKPSGAISTRIRRACHRGSRSRRGMLSSVRHYPAAATRSPRDRPPRARPHAGRRADPARAPAARPPSDPASERGRRLPRRAAAASDPTLVDRARAAKEALGDRVFVLGPPLPARRGHPVRRRHRRQLQARPAGGGPPEAEFIVFAGVHFMAESADILTAPSQKVLLPDLAPAAPWPTWRPSTRSSSAGRTCRPRASPT
jgi:hypothetical protein